ncbi:MAG: LysM peptidoglycan-binding domain-containing protein [Pyrinomonadaceae bacterium]|nr:LysM peptidoglycan-binding domain-containing protein [Phycisphaerales bacterium]
MTRESKLAVILGFAVVLVVAALISDHFSHARQAKIGTDLTLAGPGDIGAIPPGLSTPIGSTSTVVSTHPVGTGSEDNTNLVGSIREPNGNAESSAEKSNVGPREEIHMGGPSGNPKGTAPASTPGKPDTMPSGDRAPETAIASTLPYSTGKPKNYQIKESDSLYRIAKASYGDASLWEELADYNKGRIGAKNALRAGGTLVIPPEDVLRGKAQLPPEGMVVPNKAGTAQALTTPGGGKVAPGTSGLPTDQPSDIRRIAGNLPTKKADRLVGPSPLIDKATDKKKPAEADKAAAKPGTYTVRRGDHLSSIAASKLGSTKRINDILRLNPGLDDEDSITEGMVLNLPRK